MKKTPKIRFMYPRVASTITTVEVPLSRTFSCLQLLRLRLSSSKDIHKLENLCAQFHSSAKNPLLKKDYDRIRALLKWAYTWGAVLYFFPFRSGSSTGPILVVGLRFPSPSALNSFNDGMLSAMSSATLD